MNDTFWQKNNVSVGETLKYIISTHLINSLPISWTLLDEYQHAQSNSIEK